MSHVVRESAVPTEANIDRCGTRTRFGGTRLSSGPGPFESRHSRYHGPPSRSTGSEGFFHPPSGNFDIGEYNHFQVSLRLRGSCSV